MTVNLNRIKAERTAKGYTQEEMARKLRWTRSKYAKRESGSVPLGADELALIATTLNIPNNEMGIFFDLNVPERQHN